MHQSLTMRSIRQASAPEPSPEEVVLKAKRLLPLLHQRSRQDERNRRLAAETIASMQEAGLFRVLQPRRWGGYEIGPDVFSNVQMVLGVGDLSAAWVYGNLASLGGLLALFDDQAAQEVWGQDTSTLICCSMMRTGKAVRVASGFRLSGRWKYLSGCDHCAWAMLGGNVPSQGSEALDARLFLVPRADITLINTWETAGLKATGSHDAVIEDVFVPEYRTHRFADLLGCRGPGQSVNEAPLYRFPFGQLLACTPSTGMIGALQGMLDAFLEHHPTRLCWTGTPMSEDPVAQLVCADAASALDEMTLILRRNCRTLLAQVERGETPLLTDRMRYKFQSASMAERCSLLAARLFKATGAVALFEDRPFGRFLADINAARQHVANQYEALGRNWGASLLGLESAIDFFL